MAYSTLASLENTIDQILDHDRFSIHPSERKQILSLHKRVVLFRAFLEDFREKAKNLEARIRDVAAEAENVIEWFMLEKNPYAYRGTKWIAILKFRYQLLKVSREMNSIATKVVDMKNSIIVRDAQLSDSPATASPYKVADIGNTNMVDPHEDLIQIMDRLCGETKDLQYLSIYGMGGIGKTTLARNAYHHQIIVEHFQIRVWVTISQDYSEERILLDLLDSMKEFYPEQTDESMEEDSDEECSYKIAKRSQHCNEFPAERSDQGHESPEEISEQINESLRQRNSEMAEKVHKILAGRRFLIVMDDMWSTKVLDDVKLFFPDYNNGSKIMLTTRLKDVATYANSSLPSHEMHLMGEDKSWILLRQKVFLHQDSISPELEHIGREIARSCGGLPLAIVVIAGVLSSVSQTLTSWEVIAKNVKQSLAAADGQIEKILSLSYTHLPHHLRACFLYMGGFPKDHRIKVEDLTRLWIAEGFVKPCASKRLEDTAEEYVEELANRSLIVVNKSKSSGKIKHCSLHDMVREMCIKLCHEEKFLLHVKSRQELRLLKDQRRISISQSNLNLFTNSFSSTIRTILYFQDTLDSFGSFRLLRVLDVLRIRFNSRLIPDQFFKLFHLRYLAFRCFYSVPRAISNLRSLQTLIIEGFGYVLPREIWNMPKLRHLICYGNKITRLDGATFALETLQTLHLYNFRSSIPILNMIPNIKKLWLSYSWVDGDLLFHNLPLLEKLHLELGYSLNNSRDVHLAVPSSLKKLTLIGWGCDDDPYLNIVGPFPNLEALKLRRFNFMRREWRTTDEDFPQLKYLLIDRSNIWQWSAEGSHFPRLKAILIHSCWCLKEMPDGIGDIPTLELIELKHCRKSLVESAKLVQDDLQSYGYDDFQLLCTDCNLELPQLPLPRARLER